MNKEQSKYESIDRCYFCKLPCDQAPGLYCTDFRGATSPLEVQKPWVEDFLANKAIQGKAGFGHVDARKRRGKNFLKLLGRRI